MGLRHSLSHWASVWQDGSQAAGLRLKKLAESSIAQQSRIRSSTHCTQFRPAQHLQVVESLYCLLVLKNMSGSYGNANVVLDSIVSPLQQCPSTTCPEVRTLASCANMKRDLSIF